MNLHVAVVVLVGGTPTSDCRSGQSHVKVFCMWHVLVMYPMKKITVVVDSIACSLPLGYYFRHANIPNLQLVPGHVACTGHVPHEPILFIVVEHLQLVAFYILWYTCYIMQL